MENLQSINSKNLASDGLPLFLGDPNLKPEPIFPEFPWYIILAAAGVIGDYTKRDTWPPPELTLRRIIQAANKLGPEKAEECFKKFLNSWHYWRTDPDYLWDTLAEAMRPAPLVLKMPPLKTKRDVAPGRSIEQQPVSKPAPGLVGIAIIEAIKNLPTRAQVKHYALVRKATTFDYILEESGYMSFARVHEFIKHHGNFQRSKPGKIVYDAGFAWIEKKLKLSPRRVCSAFKWLAQHKLVTKLGPADPRIHRNSTWYVCSTMKQNLKLWALVGGR